MFVSLARLSVVYIVKEVVSFLGAQSINGCVAKKNISAVTDQPGSSRKDEKLLITVVYSRETVYIMQEF